MNLADAGRIIEVIDERISKRTYSESRVETTWATVASVDATNRLVSAYLYGDSPYQSEDFRVREGFVPNVGDSIKVAIDKARGDRWVEEIYPTTSYSKVEFDITNGQVRFGPGTGLADVTLSRVAIGELRITGVTGINNPLLRLWSGPSPAASNYTALAVNRDGDSAARVVVGYMGDIQRVGLALGSGSASRDMFMTRASYASKTAWDFVDANNTLGQWLNLTAYGAATVESRAGYAIRVNGDTGYRAILTNTIDGSTHSPGILLGDGAATDVNLYRQAANTLRTDDSLQVNHNSGIVVIGTGNTTIRNLAAEGDANPVWRVLNSGTMEWGPGGASGVDTNLFRAAADVLRTNDALSSMRGSATDITFQSVVTGDSVGRLNIFADGTLQWSSGSAAFDVNLYRTAANVLKSDDKFDPASLNVQVKAGAPVDGDIVGGAASGDMVLDTTNNRIYFRVGTTWRFAALT